VELAPSGKAHLLPIAILVDGKFYDASAYKAAPVPLALYSETVYEAERSGVSLGLFTVTGALQTKDAWIGEGTWHVGLPASGSSHHTDIKPRMDDDEGPPRLRQRASDKPSPPAEPPASTSSNPKPEAPPAAAPGTASETTPTGVPSTVPPDASGSAADENDPNRPVLKRGRSQAVGAGRKSSNPVSASATAMAAPSGPSKSPATGSDASGSLQLIPAVSDADGPEPRPYTYDLKGSEEQSYRKKMLALAAEAVQARARQIVPLLPGSQAQRAASSPAGKQPQPSFEDVQFRAFDLWNTNEPVFVFSAKAKMPPVPSSRSALTYLITVVAKADLYGELRKLQVNLTDSQHLDEIPRMELIDAVDADGDGRGELLFRRISEAGVAWAIYRATADQLYPLFEGTPSGQARP